MSTLQPLSDIQELFERGAHYGYSRRRRHPSVAAYIYSFKNRTAIIDLEKTLAALARAEEFLQSLGQGRRSVLFVGTKPEAQPSIAAAGRELTLPYVARRWIGGTLTNLTEVKKRLARLKELKEQLAVGKLEKYTKQERANFNKELESLERTFSTVAGLAALPSALVVVDPNAEKIAASEAGALGLPIVALAGTDCDIRSIDYPIVINDGSVRAIDWVLGRLVVAYQNGLKSAPPPAATPAGGQAAPSDKAAMGKAVNDHDEHQAN